jgi:hypothetical protein
MERTPIEILRECGYVVNEMGILHTYSQPNGTGSVQFIAWEDVRGISSHQVGLTIKINLRQSTDSSIGQGMFFRSTSDTVIVYKYLASTFVEYVTKTK